MLQNVFFVGHHELKSKNVVYDVRPILFTLDLLNENRNIWIQRKYASKKLNCCSYNKQNIVFDRLLKDISPVRVSNSCKKKSNLRAA